MRAAGGRRRSAGRGRSSSGRLAGRGRQGRGGGSPRRGVALCVEPCFGGRDSTDHASSFGGSSGVGDGGGVGGRRPREGGGAGVAGGVGEPFLDAEELVVLGDAF